VHGPLARLHPWLLVGESALASCWPRGQALRRSASMFGGLGVRGGQSGASASDARADGPDRAVADFGCLLIAVADELGEDERVALVVEFVEEAFEFDGAPAVV